MTAIEQHAQSDFRNGGSADSFADKVNSGAFARGLGWFSVGLGLAEVLSPGALAGLIGIRNNPKNRRLLRRYGMREIGAGVGLLVQPHASRWAWGRVAGDVVDLSSLASAFRSSRSDKGRLTAATIAVAGVTALDVICAKGLTNGNGAASSARVSRSIAVQCSPEQAYSYWRDIENLPHFMSYLKSVKVTGDRRSHWTANGPMGSTVEWDAEITQDEPNRMIAWRSVNGASFENEGNVRFEKAPGDRGTLVRVEMDLAPGGGGLGTVRKILGVDAGRRIAHDLRNFKQILELGEVTESDASVYRGMHPAQPAKASV